jgi:hypothetical protein
MEKNKWWSIIIKIFLIIIFIVLGLGLLYFILWTTSSGVTSNRCSKLGGEIVNNLEGKGCESGWKNIGKIKPNLDGSMPNCPCICCVREAENNIVDKGFSKNNVFQENQGIDTSYEDISEKNIITTDSELENRNIKESNGLARREGDKLILKLDNGREKTIVDIVGETDVPQPKTAESTYNSSSYSHFYNYDKLYEEINYYGVYVGYYVGMSGGTSYLLVNKINGNQVPVASSKILISPDKQRVVSHNIDLISGFTTNGFQILNRKDDNFYIEYKSSPNIDWGPSSARWLSNTEIEFEKTKLDNYDEKVTGVIRYKLNIDSWGNNSWIEVK